jgi:glycosyltransferase involved in cell wall biosynthesis
MSDADGAAPSGIRRQPRSLSCVVPCHNESRNLVELLPILAAVLESCAFRWEIILVDDGSTDATHAAVETWLQSGHVRLLELSRNFGKEAALTAGLEAAAGDVVVLMDADLQHPPALIATFVKQWMEGADVVFALRSDRQDESAFKRLGTRWFYRLVNATGRFEVPEGAGDFRLMDRTVVDTLLALPERNRFMKGLYAWVGYRTVAVPYVPPPRLNGRTNFNVMQLISLSLDGLTSFTTWPLRALSVAGFALALMAMAYGAYLTGSYLLYGNETSGWTTIAVSLMAFAGIQLISLGILGEYIGRIFEEVKRRPLFVVRKSSGQGLKAEE